MHIPTVSWRSKVLNHRLKDFFFFFFFFFHVYFWIVLAGISIGKLQIRMLGYFSFSIQQFDWLGFLLIVCELCTKIGTVRDPIESADASKVATRCRSDACGSYLNKGILVPLMVNFRRTWFTARDDCKSKGGTLVVILNESQQHFLQKMMSSINV